MPELITQLQSQVAQLETLIQQRKSSHQPYCYLLIAQCNLRGAIENLELNSTADANRKSRIVESEKDAGLQPI